MNNVYHTKKIADLQVHFGVSNECAKYIFYRSIRHKKRDNKYIEWTLQLQNALIIADKCLGINWDALIFGQESDVLATHGIHVKDMGTTVFRWTAGFDTAGVDTADKTADSANTDTREDSGESAEKWITVTKKRKPKKIVSNLCIYM